MLVVIVFKRIRQLRGRVSKRDVKFALAVAVAAGTAGYLSPGVVDMISTLLPLLLAP